MQIENNRIRLFVSALLVIAADLSAFYLSIRSGISWNVAHVISFVPVSASVCVLWILWLPKDNSAQEIARSLSACLIIAMLALFLRGGVLATLVEVIGWSPKVAIIPSVAVSSAVILSGIYLQVLSRKANVNEHGNGGRILSIAVILYLVMLRFFYGGPFELLHEEGYYWNYAQHLDIGYLDHPPMVGWLIWVFTTILGDSEFAVRLGALVCWAITAYYAYRLTYAVYGARIAVRALLLVALLPVFFCFGLLMMPDAPLLACWAGSLYYLYRALIEEQRAAWLGVGIFMGLGMLSKYTMALLGVATLVFLLVDHRSRKWFFRPEPYLAFLLVLLLFSPVIIWNAEHEWASFYFQGPSRLEGSFDFDLPDLIGSVLLLLTPAGLASAIATVTTRRTVISETGNPKSRRIYGLLLTLTVSPLSVFVIFSLFRNIKLNWTAPIWLGILPYIAVFTALNKRKTTGRLAAWASHAWLATIIIVPIFYGALLHYLVLGFPAVPYPRRTLLGTGMQDLAQKVETIVETFERKTGEKPAIVCMDTDRMAGWIAFYRTKIAGSRHRSEMPEAARDTTGGHLFGKNSHMYRYWHPIEMYRNRVILLISKSMEDMADERLKMRGELIGDIQKLVVEKNGKPLGTYFCRFLWVKVVSNLGSRSRAAQPLGLSASIRKYGYVF